MGLTRSGRAHLFVPVCWKLAVQLAGKECTVRHIRGAEAIGRRIYPIGAEVTKEGQANLDNRNLSTMPTEQKTASTIFNLGSLDTGFVYRSGGVGGVPTDF